LRASNVWIRPLTSTSVASGCALPPAPAIGVDCAADRTADAGPLARATAVPAAAPRNCRRESSCRLSGLVRLRLAAIRLINPSTGPGAEYGGRRLDKSRQDSGRAVWQSPPS